MWLQIARNEQWMGIFSFQIAAYLNIIKRDGDGYVQQREKKKEMGVIQERIKNIIAIREQEAPAMVSLESVFHSLKEQDASGHLKSQYESA